MCQMFDLLQIKKDPNDQHIQMEMFLSTILSSWNDVEKGALTSKLANCTYTLLCTNCRWVFEYCNVCHCSV